MLGSFGLILCNDLLLSICVRPIHGKLCHGRRYISLRGLQLWGHRIDVFLQLGDLNGGLLQHFKPFDEPVLRELDSLSLVAQDSCVGGEKLKEGCWRHVVVPAQLVLECNRLTLNRLMNLLEHLNATIQ